MENDERFPTSRPFPLFVLNPLSVSPVSTYQIILLHTKHHTPNTSDSEFTFDLADHWLPHSYVPPLSPVIHFQNPDLPNQQPPSPMALESPNLENTSSKMPFQYPPNITLGPPKDHSTPEGGSKNWGRSPRPCPILYVRPSPDWKKD